MGAQLKSLHELQKIEIQLAVFQADIDQRQRQIQIQKRALERQQGVTEESKEAVKQTQMEIDRIDLEMKSNDEAIAKHREALNQTKSNKDYAAVLAALNTEKADNLKLETHALTVMGDVDSLRLKTEESNTACEEIRQRIKKAQTKLENYEEQIAADRRRLQEERDVVVAQLAPSVVATFDRVAERHEGEAMAIVTRLHPKRADHVCGGCNMALTLELLNGLRTRDEIQMCNCCGRILYLDTATEQSANS